MLDIRRIRMNPEEVIKALEKRKGKFPIDKVLELDEKRRRVLTEVEEMKARQNTASKQVPKLKKEGKDASHIFTEMKTLSDKIKELDVEVKGIDEELKITLLQIPNTPNDSVVEGDSDEDNVELRKNGEPKKFEFEPKAHWDIGTDLKVLDFEAATKITGTRFTLFRGLGSRLERALINFMVDLHTE